VATAYQLKPGPYSSHTRLIQLFPQTGQRRRVLDVGCADGFLARRLAQMGYKVVGIDQHAKAPHVSSNGFEFVDADLDRGMPRLSGLFDYVLCADILEHLRDPLQLLIDLRSKLAPSGSLVASLPNSGNLYFRLNVLMGRFPAQDRGLFDRTHLHFYTWGGWADLLARGGFRIEKVFPTGVPVGLAVPEWENTLTVRLLERIAYVLAGVWKSLFAYQFVIVARPEVQS
jgi:SAM-dependent methyltransferase